MNLSTLTYTELTKLRLKVLAEIKARRPRAPKVTVRKQRSVEERERERKYAEFSGAMPCCWICGRAATDKPSWWNGPFLIERMHIVNKTRVEDVRAIIAGCSLCHRIQHGDRFPQSLMRPQTMTELLELKREYDPDNYDPEFLQKHSVRKLIFP